VQLESAQPGRHVRLTSCSYIQPDAPRLDSNPIFCIKVDLYGCTFTLFTSSFLSFPENLTHPGAELAQRRSLWNRYDDCARLRKLSSY
jgi:hypothetical protein